MDQLRSRISYLFYASGVLHLLYVAWLLLLLRPIDSTLVIVTVFGIAFLVVGYYLVRGGATIALIGAAVALLGALVSIAGLILQYHFMSIIFLLLDLVMIASCAYLYTRTRRLLHTA